jgi:hypothetical protein
MKHLIAAVFVAVTLSGAVSAWEPLYVFIFTAKPAPGGIVPLDFMERSDSVKDLMSNFQPQPVAMRIRVTKKREDADVVIEVLSREREAADAQTFTVHVRVTAGDFSMDVTGRCNRAPGTDTCWSDASDDARNQVVKWINGNEKRLLARRPPKAKK